MSFGFPIKSGMTGSILVANSRLYKAMSSLQKLPHSMLFGLLIISWASLILTPLPVSSYSEKTTHPALTSEVVDFYNLFFDQKITSDEKEWVIRGSIDEDAFPRYLNHFYDPIHHKGWAGVGLSSKEWGKSSAVQSSRSSSLASRMNVVREVVPALQDFSWERGVQEYAKGNRRYAFLALGHALHLLEDSSVPEHTRNDTHIAGNHYTNSPFEDWARKFTRENLHIAEELKAEHQQPKTINSYDGYFDEVARYSNGYFFSEDTILSKEYSLPTVSREASGRNTRGKNVLFAYGKDESGKELLLAILKGDLTWRNLGEEQVSTLNDLTILDGYWSHLAPKAITYGAGLARLFIEEGERAKAELAKNPPKQSFLAAMVGVMKGVLGIGVTPRFDEKQSTLTIRNKLTTLDESVDENLDFVDNTPVPSLLPTATPTLAPTSKPSLSPQKDKQGLPEKPSLNPADAPKSPIVSGVTQETKVEKSSKNVVAAPSAVASAPSTSLAFPILAPKQYVEASPSPKQNAAPTPTPLVASKSSATPTPTPTVRPEPSSTPTPTPTLASAPAPSPTPMPSVVSTPTPTAILSPTPSLAPVSTSTPQPDTTAPGQPTLSNLVDGEEFTGASDVEAFTPGVQVAISGTAEANALVTASLTPLWSTTAASNGAWSLVITLHEGANEVVFKAKDAAGNESTTLTRTVTLDSLPPEASIAFQNYALTRLSFEITWGVATTTPDVANYDVEQHTGISSAWTPLYTQTTVTATTSTSTRETVNYFRVRARDTKGNISGWVEAQAETNQRPVVINEIMYNPNPGSDSSYEYIELYNRSSSAIDLSGWSMSVDGLQRGLTRAASATSTGMILEPGGFALIGDKPSSASAPNIYDGAFYTIPAHSPTKLRLTLATGSLTLRNASPWSALVLKDDRGTVIDEAAYQSSYGGNDNGKSLERINPAQGGATQANWAESPVGGTPNEQNTSFNPAARPGTTVSDTTNIVSDTIWSKAGSPYLIVSNSGKIPKVSQGATLYVESGVTIKPQSASYTNLDVQGALKAEGTSAEPIIITSSKNTPARGDWRAIAFGAAASDSLFRHVVVEYGGADFIGMVSVAGSNVVFEDATFRQAKDNALVVTGGSPTIKNSLFQNNGSFGIDVTGGSPLIENVGFTGNIGPVRFRPSTQPVLRGNAASANTLYNGIYVTTGSLSTTTAWNKDLPYLLESNAGQFITVASSTRLTLEPGVTLKPLNKYYDNLVVSGSLSAVGTVQDPIVITSSKNDSRGGDSNANGSASLPVAGDWKRVLFKAGSNSILQNIYVEYGGFENFAALTFERGATVATSSITFSNNVVNSQGP